MIHYDQFKLRQMNESDLDIVLKWRNSDRIRENMYTDQIITLEEHHAWFARLQQHQNDIYLEFEYESRPIGIVNFSQFDWRNAKCLWGFYIGEVDAPRGSGLAMGYFALEYIFENQSMRKLCGEVFAFNAASINYHKKLGFVEEGRYVEHVMKNGKFEDVIFMATFKEKWLKMKNQLNSICFGDKGLLS